MHGCNYIISIKIKSRLKGSVERRSRRPVHRVTRPCAFKNLATKVLLSLTNEKNGFCIWFVHTLANM